MDPCNLFYFALKIDKLLARKYPVKVIVIYANRNLWANTDISTTYYNSCSKLQINIKVRPAIAIKSLAFKTIFCLSRIGPTSAPKPRDVHKHINHNPKGF